ncbi:MAG TPA: hypothetical protein VMR70_03415 [Flavisolibacter sp.]|nr:hypothetical protein [Flavisolibacter sp.]
MIALLIAAKCLGQDNPYRNPCPHSATNGYGKGLLNFYSTNQARIKTSGSKVNQLTGDEWAYVLLKNEQIPAMDEKSRLHYDKPFDISYLVYYKSGKEIQKTWWGHTYNNPKNETVTYRTQGFIDEYKQVLKADINFFDDVKRNLKSKKFVIAEYSSPIKNRDDILITNTVFVPTGTISDLADYTTLTKFFNDFASKFENVAFGSWSNRLFITTIKGKNTKYIAFFKIENGKLVGDLMAVNKVTTPKIFTGIEKVFSTLGTFGSDAAVYVYGDNLYDFGKHIHSTAAKNNLLVISRNTSINRNFTETEKIISNLKFKKLKSESLTFMNGTPSSVEEATFQSFGSSDVELLKELKKEIDLKASSKVGRTITTRAELIDEITNGNNDVLFIIAHCDEKNLYFGREKVWIEELRQLPTRLNREKERVAILFSCLTGNLFSKRKGLLPFIKKNLQSLSEVFIEKNFFDLVISPPATLNGTQVLNMMDIVGDYSVLELANQFRRQPVKGEMYNVAKK